MRSLPRPSPRTQRRLSRAMQLTLLGLVTYGFLAGQTKAVTNGSIALLITFLPAILEREYHVPLDPWLGVWLTGAVLLHTLGSAGLYAQIAWWDHVTHATSASIVAGVGYTVMRGVDIHGDDIRLPNRYAFVFILIIVLAFGVIWELFEFGLDLASAQTGLTMPLAQHGLDDTVRDLMFNSIGAVIVGILGQAYLTDLASAIKLRRPRADG